MTMQIRGLGPTSADHTTPRASERRASVKALGQALKAGDLGAASEAYAALKAKAPDRGAQNDGPFAQLGTALASGDLAAARAAFVQVFTSHLPKNGGDPPAVPGGGGVVTTTPTRQDPGALLNVTA
ncbi:MAG TPA: hypothetical protein VGI48_09690 [Caldimonas sp.]